MADLNLSGTVKAEQTLSGSLYAVPGKTGGGTAGKDGGYYTPSVTQQDENTMRVSFTPSDSSMPEIASKDVTLPKGDTGATPNIQIGTVYTLPAGSPATASIGGTAENPLLNLGVPKGQGGDAGKSAYQYAVEGGYTGTEAEFAAKLAAEFPDKLPNPNALTFTGAVTGTYDGSTPLEVNIPNSGSGSSGDAALPNWRLIKTISFSAEISSVDFNIDDNGDSFALKEVMIVGTLPAYSGYIYIKPKNTGVQNSVWPIPAKSFLLWSASVNGTLKTMLAVSDTSVIWPVDKDPVCDNDIISRLVIGASAGFTGDGTMYVYGR